MILYCFNDVVLNGVVEMVRDVARCRRQSRAIV